MNHTVYRDTRSNGMATASLVLGIVGLATGCCVYTSIICGALAVIFALLSRGGEMTMSARAKTGLGLGIAGVAFGILLIVYSFSVLMIQFGSFENLMNFYYELLEGYPESLQSLQSLQTL